jgi:hypothetical protein
MVTIRSSSSEVSSPALYSPSVLNIQRRVRHSIRIVPLVQIDIGLLADQVAVSATNTLYLGERVHDLLLACNVLDR